MNLMNYAGSILCLAMLLSSVAVAEDAAQSRPNVLVFLSDDQGWGDFSMNGNRDLATPNIDALARDGARYDWFYVSPVCSPTRAEFLTGRYHPRGGVFNVSTGGERLDLDETTIADIFRRAGYATAAFGKWHNGTQHPYHPNSRGFDEYYGFTSGHWGHYFSPLLEHNSRLVQGSGYMIDDFTDRAIQFIDEHRDQPWFVYVPYNSPHSPMQVPDRWWARHKAQTQLSAHTRAAYAMCENIDWNVGRVLTKLDEFKLAENTIVIYFCDNGPNGQRFNGGMKGIKGSTDEGGVRSPLVLRWPGKIEPGTVVSSPSGAIDLLPTLADLCRVKIAGEKLLDGRSLRPLLVKSTPAPDAEIEALADRMIFSHWNGKVSLRWRQYRLDAAGQLYDLSSDLAQQKDISRDKPAVAQRLRDAVASWRRDVLGELKRQPRPFTVGHAAFHITHLPARDATFSGGIQRSSIHPNCSYLKNWRKTSDAIKFDVDVLTAGQYEAEIYYACSEANIGSTIELSSGTERVAGELTIAHDPPVVGAAEDRTPRTESYVRDFRPWNIGAIRLAAGHQTLTLRALKIPGDEALEFRLLVLTRQLSSPRPERP